MADVSCGNSSVHTAGHAIKTKRIKLPPGPPLPYGPSEDLFGWLHENFCRYGDIYRAAIYGSEVYVVSDPEYCEHILRYNWQNYVRKGQVVKRIALLLGNGLIASNGEFWKHQRRMIQPTFSKNAISQLTTMIVECNSQLLRKWKRSARNHEVVNVTSDISHLILKITLTAIFGENYEMIAPSFNILALEAARDFEFAGAFRPLGKLIMQVIEQRRRERRSTTDFLGQMMQARDRETGNLMPDAQLVREIMTLVVAGHETTASTLNWMWYLLAKHPDAHTRLSVEFNRLPWHEAPVREALLNYAYTRQVIDETLRLYPPLWLMTRRAVHDDELGEFLVPAGTEIYISPYLIQRNPRLWEAPDRFDPDRMSPENRHNRHDLAFCPFGAGPRNCIGEPLARLESQLHLMMFGRELRLHYDEERLPEMSTGMNLLSKNDFIMLPQIKPASIGASR